MNTKIQRRYLTLNTFVGLATMAACRSAGPEPARGDAAPIYGVAIPAGYRDWRLISVAREEGKLEDVRAILGNDVAIRAYRDGIRPFPDGTVIARLAWEYLPLEESARAFGHPQSFVAGPPKNGVQFMVKDSTRYAASGGWGFAQFDGGKPADEAMHSGCLPCHQNAQERDLVFNRYAP